MNNFKVPSELRLSQNWDVAVERSMVNTGVGFFIGGICSIVLFRLPSRRLALAAFGAGTGFGMAWTRNSIELEKEVKVNPTMTLTSDE